LNILLSAYACEPNKGSEPEVGWKWALALSKRGHQVYVITRKNNKNIIDEYLKKNSLDNLKFIYFDFPSWILKTIKGKSNAYAYFYIFLWQIGIFFAIKPVLKKIKFDFIHHVTFASLRFPSFLSLYNIPFIYGPVAGGDTIPFRLRKKFSNILVDALKTQLVLKGIINEDDWPGISENIFIDFLKDNYFAELKEFEIMRDRFDMMSQVESLVEQGYYSKQWVRKN